MLHTSLTLLHLLGVVIFFSNAIAALFWKAQASKSRNPVVIAHTFRVLNAGDLWLTPTSVLTITSSGVGLALLQGLPMLRTGWILWSVLAFAASGASFLAAVLPRQRRLARWTAQSASEGGDLDWSRYARETRGWSRWADASLGLAFVAFVLMVAKPGLPAL